MIDVRLPKLPAFVPSQLGPVPVIRHRKLKDKGPNKAAYLFGRYSLSQREIHINEQSTHVMQWQTLFHEWAHMVMVDAGLHNALTNEQQETLCDAFATARVVELREAHRGQQAGRKRR